MAYMKGLLMRHVMLSLSAILGVHAQMQSVPKESADIQLVPKESDDMQLVPKESDDMQLVSKEFDDMQLVPKESDDIQSVPKESGDMQLAPKESGDMQSVPKGSDDMQLAPKKSGDTQSVPKESEDMSRQDDAPNDKDERSATSSGQSKKKARRQRRKRRRGGRSSRGSRTARSESATLTSSDTTSFSRVSFFRPAFQDMPDTLTDSQISLDGTNSFPTDEELVWDFDEEVYPVIYAAPGGMISIILKMDVVVEMTVDRSLRVLCHDKFSSVCNSMGTTACILHPSARIYQCNEKTFSRFRNMPNQMYKSAVIGPRGVLFTLSNLHLAYLVSTSAYQGIYEIPITDLQFPPLNFDFTLPVFFGESLNGPEYFNLCNEIIGRARYVRYYDGALMININGILIKQMANGDVEVNYNRRHISCSPTMDAIRIHTEMVEIAAEDDGKAYVKQGTKRLHISHSGLVAADRSFTATMDRDGNIVT